MPRGTRERDILELLGACAAWEPFSGPTGARLYRLPASRGGTYTVSPGSCTCRADRYGHGVPCKHREAVRLYRLAVLTDRAHAWPQGDPPDVAAPPSRPAPGRDLAV